MNPIARTIHVDLELDRRDLTRLLAAAADEGKSLSDVVGEALRAYDDQRREREAEEWRSVWSLGGTRRGRRRSREG
jgi:predicted TIM-barrel fold metal-dependent hydrolase